MLDLAGLTNLRIGRSPGALLEKAFGPQGGPLASEIGRLALEVALGVIVFVLAARLLRGEELGYLIRR